MTAREKIRVSCGANYSMKKKSNHGGYEMKLLEIKNIYTDKIYYVKKSDVNNLKR